MRHDSFICATWRIRMCDRLMHMYDMTHSRVWYVWCLCRMTHSYVRRDVLVCVTDSCICITWLIHMCDMCHVSVPWLLHMCDMTHSFVWLLHMRDLAHSYVWLDVARCIRVWDVTNSCVWTLGVVINMWHDAFIRDMTYTCDMDSACAAISAGS